MDLPEYSIAQYGLRLNDEQALQLQAFMRQCVKSGEYPNLEGCSVHKVYGGVEFYLYSTDYPHNEGYAYFKRFDSKDHMFGYLLCLTEDPIRRPFDKQLLKETEKVALNFTLYQLERSSSEQDELNACHIRKLLKRAE